jgi:hypothetical protein
MKAKLHKLMATAVLGLALFSNSLPAWAGAAIIDKVFISSTGYAKGSLTGARYSSDSTEAIGCYSGHQPGDTPSPYIYCSARDKKGVSLYCFSADPRYVDAVKGMTDSSHIYFRVTGSASCADLEITNDSKYLR